MSSMQIFFYVFDPLTTFPFAIQSKMSMSTPTRRLKGVVVVGLTSILSLFAKSLWLSPISWRTTSSTCRPFPFIDLSASIIVSQNDRQMNQRHTRSAIFIRGTFAAVRERGHAVQERRLLVPAIRCCRQTRFHSGVHHPKKSRQSPTINNVVSLNLKVTAVMGESRRRTLAFASRRHNCLTSYCNCYDMFRHHIMLPWFISNLIFCVHTSYTHTHTLSLGIITRTHSHALGIVHTLTLRHLKTLSSSLILHFRSLQLWRRWILKQIFCCDNILTSKRRLSKLWFFENFWILNRIFRGPHQV